MDRTTQSPKLGLRLNSWLVGMLVSLLGIMGVLVGPANATPFFSTGNPDGAMGVASRPPQPGVLEIEAADDFLLSSPMSIDHASFTGLLPSGVPLSSIGPVDVELYHIFPTDSVTPPDGRVPTRMNSPSDVEFDDRSTTAGTMSFTATSVNPSFHVANTVVNGINPVPNQTTMGEGPANGNEVVFDAAFTTPFDLPAGHYFFVPQVQLPAGSDFLWLSAPRPIVAPGTPFNGDLQAWVRNENLAPDWLRVGADIVGGTVTFNETFSLSGTVTPEPSSLLLFGTGTASFALLRCRRSKRQKTGSLNTRAAS